MLPLANDSKCPSSIVVQKEDCKAAGLAVGGMLQDGDIVEGSWTDRPSGCFFGPVIHYNTNDQFDSQETYALGNTHWHSVCHKMKVRFQSNFIYIYIFYHLPQPSYIVLLGSSRGSS